MTEVSTELSAVDQTAVEFMAPVAASYFVICLTWWLVKYFAGDRWADAAEPTSTNKWLDLVMVVVCILSIFSLGQAYRAGFRIPEADGNLNYLVVAINLCVPFLPIFAVLALRRQSTLTIWTTHHQLGWKFGAGIVASLTGLATYLTVSGDWQRLGSIFADFVSLHSLSHAAPVFLEGLAIAFVFVRLRWVAPAWLAVLIPSLLFAAAHIPRFLETGQDVWGLVVFVSFNTLVAVFVFATILRARDIIWLALPHYLMDIAIQAFR